MNNTVIVVGRLVRYPELKLTDSGKKVSTITIAVPRSYKNVQGEYETDFVDCTLWTSIAENTAEYCKTGDVVGIRGRLQTKIIETEDGAKYKRMEVIAEKVNFISSHKNNTSDTVNTDMIAESTDDSDEDLDSNADKKVSKVGKKKK